MTNASRKEGMSAQDEAKRLVETYTSLIMRIGYTYLKSVDDAEDICQETLFKLVERREPFAGEEHERAWVVRVTINACKNMLDSAARRRSVDLDAVEEPVAREVLRHPVLDAVCELPEAYREVIVLHYSEGYKIREIAQMTGKTRHAVAKNLSRAREMLRAALGDDFR